MKPKTTIRLVYLVCCFVYHAFVEKDKNMAKMTIREIEELEN